MFANHYEGKKWCHQRANAIHRVPLPALRLHGRKKRPVGCKGPIFRSPGKLVTEATPRSNSRKPYGQVFGSKKHYRNGPHAKASGGLKMKWREGKGRAGQFSRRNLGERKARRRSAPCSVEKGTSAAWEERESKGEIVKGGSGSKACSITRSSLRARFPERGGKTNNWYGDHRIKEA